MTATIPTQAQVDQIAQTLAPDVIRIRLQDGHDWAEYPAFYFRVLLADDASLRERLSSVAKMVRARVSESLQLSKSDRTAYFWFRSRSEQEKLREAAWD